MPACLCAIPLSIVFLQFNFAQAISQRKLSRCVKKMYAKL